MDMIAQHDERVDPERPALSDIPTGRAQQVTRQVIAQDRRPLLLHHREKERPAWDIAPPVIRHVSLSSPDARSNHVEYASHRLHDIGLVPRPGTRCVPYLVNRHPGTRCVPYQSETVGYASRTLPSSASYPDWVRDTYPTWSAAR